MMKSLPELCSFGLILYSAAASVVKTKETREGQGLTDVCKNDLFVAQ